VVERFRMYEYKLFKTPLGHHTKLSVTQANGVGNLMYEMVCSKPNIAHVISVVSRFMTDLECVDWETLNWVLRYLNGIISLGLMYR